MQIVLVSILALILTSSTAQAGDIAIDRPRGRVIYETYCIACHGAGGRGDGPSADALIPKPRDFTNGEVKESLSKKIITDVVANGKPGTQMEAWKNKISAQDIQEVMEYTLSLK